MQHVFIPKTHMIPRQVRVYWLKEECANVYKRRAIARVEGEFLVTSEGPTTDMLQIEPSQDGILRKRLVEDGAEVPEGTVIAFIGSEDEPLPLGNYEEVLILDLPGEPLLQRRKTTSPKLPIRTTYAFLVFFWVLYLASLWEALQTPLSSMLYALIGFVLLMLTFRTLHVVKKRLLF